MIHIHLYSHDATPAELRSRLVAQRARLKELERRLAAAKSERERWELETAVQEKRMEVAETEAQQSGYF